MIDHALSRPALLRPLGLWQCRLLAGLILTALADWLFYGHPIGLSAALFLMALCACSLLTNPVGAAGRTLWAAAGLLAAALIPLLVDDGILPLLYGAGGAAWFALTAAGAWSGSLKTRAIAVIRQWLAGPTRLVSDILRGWRLVTRRGKGRAGFESLSVWAIPVVLGAIFLVLFSRANPLISFWLSQIDLGVLLKKLDGWRIAYWLLVLCAAWPFLHVKLRKAKEKPVSAVTASPAAPIRNLLLGDRTILRSLLLFNALFALQTGLDITFLWAGVALPNGMTYATYAHRGAYPLICTAVLAAGFVLAALRPGSAAERSPLIRGLVFAWIGQNVLLVISSILRLDLYIAVYALTWLRMAAFVWMLLVAIGLILIIVRIALSRSNGWLIGANLRTLGIALYVCSLINLPAIVADHNVDHCKEVSGQGVALDTRYLLSLGPQAIPAIDRFIAHRQAQAANGEVDMRLPSLIARRNQMATANAATLSDWRAWTFRRAQLRHYLFSAAADNDGTDSSPVPGGQ